MADIISGGRMGVAITGGYVPSEFEMYGRQLAERPKAVAETIETLRRAWTGERLEFRGTADGPGAAPTGAATWPAHPDGGASAAAARHAARIADGFVPSIPELWDDYRAAPVEVGKPDPGPMPPRGQAFHHISRDPEEAWGRIAPYCVHEVTSYAQWNAGSGAVMDYSSGDDAPVPALDADSVRAMGIYPVLSPKEAAAECRRLGEHGTFTLHPLCGGLSPEIAWESLGLFEAEVLPELD